MSFHVKVTNTKNKGNEKVSFRSTQLGRLHRETIKLLIMKNKTGETSH
jgi:hypothetical protein